MFGNPVMVGHSTLCPVGGRIQKRIELPHMLPRDRRVHAWQPLSLLGSGGDQTGVGIGRTQHGAVEGSRWSGQVLRADDLPRDFGRRVDARRLSGICSHDDHHLPRGNDRGEGGLRPS
jgi:hypothetical protein